MAGVLAVVALIAGGFVLLGGGDEPTDQLAAPRNEVFLEAATEPGPDPFTPSVATPSPPSTVPVPTVPATASPATTARPRTRPTAPPPAAIQSVAGNRPGLFGAARSQASCDGASLARQLAADPAKVRAFAAIVGTTPDQLATRIDGFTPLILQGDTRVTNHGFEDGSASPRQSLLEAGTAVLVDATGVPRVRCSGGNPLSEPEPLSGATFSGDPWPAFDPTAISVVSPSPQPMAEFVVREITTGQPIIRPTGTDGANDAPAPPNTRLEPPIPASSTTTTMVAAATTSTNLAGSTTTTTVDDAKIPQPNAFVARDGTASASSEGDAASAATRAIDGDPGTAWLGTQPPSLQFTWTGRQDDLVTRIRITGGTGFTRVKVEVVDELGDPDFEQTVDVSGDIVVRPGVDGRGIRLTFTPMPGFDRAGFAELEVGVTR